jgi:phosphoserine phosphatase RsbU/P
MTLIANTERLDRLRALTEVSRALTYATSIEEVLELAVQRAAQIMGADKSVIMLNDADGLLVVRASYGLDRERVRHLREPLSETLIQRLQVLLDYPSPDCFLSVPLVVQGEVTGILASVRAGTVPVAEDDEWLLSALADQAAVALENARLADAVRTEHLEMTRMAEAQSRTRATLGHELRVPLSAILSYASLLLDGVHGPLNDRQSESVARIRIGGQHLLAIIENVLDAVQLTAGHIPMASVDLRVAGVLSEALDLVRPRLAEQQQQIRLHGADLVVRGDPNRLRQALVNILGNASKYSPKGVAIDVTVAPREHQGQARAAIAITDPGRGIPATAQGSLFQAYSRAGAPAHEPGLGLGLYICRQLIRQMGGDIEVQSEEGRGSTFTVLLPLGADPAAQARTGSSDGA